MIVLLRIAVLGLGLGLLGELWKDCNILTVYCNLLLQDNWNVTMLRKRHKHKEEVDLSEAEGAMEEEVVVEKKRRRE